MNRDELDRELEEMYAELDRAQKEHEALVSDDAEESANYIAQLEADIAALEAEEADEDEDGEPAANLSGSAPNIE